MTLRSAPRRSTGDYTFVFAKTVYLLFLPLWEPRKGCPVRGHELARSHTLLLHPSSLAAKDSLNFPSSDAVSLSQGLSGGADFVRAGIWQCLKVFLVVLTGAEKGCFWHLVVKAHAAAEHSTMHSTSLSTTHTKNYLTQNVNSAKVKKYYPTLINFI